MEFFSKKYITRNFFLLALSFVGMFYPSFFSAQAAFPVISNVSVSNVTAQGATVSWTTDIPASSLVDFGTSTAYGTTMGNPDELVTSHSVVLTGLFPLTQHYFRVRSANGGDQTINNNGGAGFTVTTTAAPVISQVRLISVSDTQAIITFRTDIPAYPYIGYGLTDSYGSLIGDEVNFGVNHSITLYGLTPGKQYYYKPRVGDVYKNYTYFPGNNFFTTSGPYLQSITTTTSNGTYGPGTQIPIVATYQENVVSGSANITVTLNTGVQIDLNQVSGNTISGLYVVGATGSGQNISSLAVASIEYQNVCDSDGFCYRGTTLPSININDNSTVAIDTTAPVFSNIQPIDIWPWVFNSITTASDISYTVSENLQSGTIKFLRTGGTIDSGSPHTCTLTGVYLNFGTRNNFNMNNCQEGVPTLVDGSVYTIRFEGTDLVGNNATRVDRVSMQFDTISPTLISFTSSTPNGTYGAGSIITIIPNFNEPARGSMKVILDTGVEVTLSYNGVEDVFRGFYTVGDISSGQSSQDLTVTQISYMNVSDLAGNTTVNTSMTGIQGNNLGDNSNIVIDTAIADAPSLVQFMTDPINNANKSNITLRVEGDLGTTIHYSIDDTNGTTPPVTGNIPMEIDGSTDIGGINLSSLRDGTITAQVQLEKTNGEFSSFAQDSVIKDTDLPGWYMQYYADSAFTTSLGDNPRLSPGTYYIRITFYEGEPLDETTVPKMFINAQGTLNDVNLIPLEKVSSTVYRFTRTIVYDPEADGSVLEDVYIDSLTDFYGNTSTNVNPYIEYLKSAYTDTIKPTVTGDVTPNYAKAGMVNVSLTFSEEMKQTIPPTVRLRKNNGTFSNVNGSYTSATVWTGSVEIFSGDSNGPADLQVSLAQDRAGNVMTANENVFNFFIDTQSPTIAINMGTDVDQGPVKTDTINLTALDGSGSGIVTRSYGFSSDFVCNVGDTYPMSFQDSVSFEITGNETRFLCARAVDRAGNTAYQLVGKLNVDNTAPTIHSVTSDTTNGSYKAGATVQIRVNFSENITTVGNLEILLETGAIDRGCTMSVYQANYGICDYIVQEGDTSSDLNQISLVGVVEDLARNVLTNYTPQTSLAVNKNIVIDTTPPVINILSPLGGSSVSGSTIVFFTNTEPTLSQCSFDGTVWSNCASGATSLQLIDGWSTLPEGASVLYVRDTDLAGNVGIDTETGLLKDTNFPMVEDVTADRLSGFYKAGTQVPLIITFSRAVTSTGNVIVTLETGTVDRSCTFSITNATEGRCTYTVQEGDTSDDLNVISVSGTIRDSIGNSLASPIPIVNLADNKDIVIDTTRPMITSVNSTHSNGTFTVGEEIDITATFSEPVTSDNITINLDSGGSCSFTLLTATNTGTCIYTVGEGQNSLDLTTSSITGVIRDRAQNEMSNFSPQINLGANKNIKIDTTPSGPPRVTSITSEKNDGAYTVGALIPVTVNFSEKVIVSGTVTVTFETGMIDRSCTIEAQSINNTTFGTCTYTVREGDISPDLSVKSISGNIYDVVNNQMVSPALPEINLNDLKNIIIDTTPPGIPIITLTNPITDVNKSNITLSGTGEANATIEYSIDDTNPLTQAKTGTGVVSAEGVINLTGINLTGLDGGAITTSVILIDSAGNVSGFGFATATSQILLPIITSITSNKENGFYPLGETIDIRVQFSENVTSNGEVTVVLETGVIDRSCTFIMNNANVGVCNYTIQLGDTTNDLNVKFVSGEIYDQADNPLVNFSIGSNLADNKNIAIDTVAPSAPNVTMTNPITDANKTNITLSGTGEANAVIKYTINDQNPDTNPIEGSEIVASDGSISLTGINLTGLDGGTITASIILEDSAGNASEPRVLTSTSQIVLPIIESITSEKEDGYYREGDKIDIRVQFSENVTSNGEVTVVLETGDSDGICSFVLQNSSLGVCEYVVGAGQNSSHLNVVSISGIIADQAGNPLLYFTPQSNLADSKNIVIDTTNVRLDAFTSSSENRTYGPNEQIVIIAKYSEVVREGSVISLTLDTGATVVLNAISLEDPTSLVGTYQVGNPGSGEGTMDLKVDSIVSQNVCDLAGNCLIETSESFPGINISSQSAIIVDAVSPVFSEVLPENSTNVENLTNDSDISYVLSEDLEWGTIIITRTAWAEDPGSPHVCTLVGDDLKSGRHDKFNTEHCESGAITLTTGTVYSFTFNGEDFYGNPAREVLKTGISYGLDVTAPIISSVMVDEITSVSAVIRWVTDENANAFVDFGLENNYSNLRGSSSLGGTEHTVLLNGLSPGITYTFRVRSFDGTLNEAVDDNNGEGYVFTTLNLPSVTNTEVSEITFQGAIISWEVDTEVYSYLAYGESESFGKAMGDESNLKSQQEISLDGLKSDQEYFYRIKMRDVYGNISFSPIYTFSTLSDPTDKEPPLISEIAVTEISSKNAKFSWKTDESADSYIEYGLSEEYGEIYGSGSFVKDHAILLPPLLTPLTTYYFRVISSDRVGNKSVSENMTFITTEIDPSLGAGDNGAGDDGGSGDEKYGDPGEPISFSNIKVSSKTSSSIIVSWETNKPTNGLIRFGLDEKYGSTVAEDLSVDAKENFITKHEIIISNLLYNSTYNYRIVSYDAFGNIGLSSPGKFQTSNIFSVSGVNVSNITLNSAIITWETGDPVTTMLEYGKTISYGEKVENLEISNYHKVELTNLDAGETYHFRVRGERKDDSSIASDDYVFATYPEPMVEGYSVEKVSDSSASINWRTNVPTESLVSYINAQDPLDTGIQGTTEIKNDHAVEVIGLKQGSDYEFRIKGIDINKNLFESDPFNVRTDIDLTPPEISFINSKTSMVSEAEEIIQAIISWKTNEPATSQLFFDVGMGVTDLTQQTKIDENLTTNHVVVLTDLRPGSVYRFNAVSQDANENLQKSETFSFLTPRKEKSVFQLIIANFEETFGWLKGGGR